MILGEADQLKAAGAFRLEWKMEYWTFSLLWIVPPSRRVAICQCSLLLVPTRVLASPGLCTSEHLYLGGSRQRGRKYGVSVCSPLKIHFIEMQDRYRTELTLLTDAPVGS